MPEHCPVCSFSSLVVSAGARLWSIPSIRLRICSSLSNKDLLSVMVTGKEGISEVIKVLYNRVDLDVIQDLTTKGTSEMRSFTYLNNVRTLDVEIQSSRKIPLNQSRLCELLSDLPDLTTIHASNSTIKIRRRYTSNLIDPKTNITHIYGPLVRYFLKARNQVESVVIPGVRMHNWNVNSQLNVSFTWTAGSFKTEDFIEAWKNREGIFDSDIRSLVIEDIMDTKIFTEAIEMDRSSFQNLRSLKLKPSGWYVKPFINALRQHKNLHNLSLDMYNAQPLSFALEELQSCNFVNIRSLRISASVSSPMTLLVTPSKWNDETMSSSLDDLTIILDLSDRSSPTRDVHSSMVLLDLSILGHQFLLVGGPLCKYGFEIRERDVEVKSSRSIMQDFLNGMLRSEINKIVKGVRESRAPGWEKGNSIRAIRNGAEKWVTGMLHREINLLIEANRSKQEPGWKGSDASTPDEDGGHPVGEGEEEMREEGKAEQC